MKTTSFWGTGMSDRILRTISRHIESIKPGSGCRALSRSTSLCEDLGLDSLDAVSLIMQIEEETGAVASDEELVAAVTVGHLAAVAERARLQ